MTVLVFPVGLSRYLVSKITGESSAVWATREYAMRMGLPDDIFAYDGFTDPEDGPEFSPGGGQFMSCRDHLRVAQLLLNKGRWADDDGAASLEYGAGHHMLGTVSRTGFPALRAARNRCRYAGSRAFLGVWFRRAVCGVRCSVPMVPVGC